MAAQKPKPLSLAKIREKVRSENRWRKNMVIGSAYDKLGKSNLTSTKSTKPTAGPLLLKTTTSTKNPITSRKVKSIGSTVVRKITESIKPETDTSNDNLEWKPKPTVLYWSKTGTQQTEPNQQPTKVVGLARVPLRLKRDFTSAIRAIKSVWYQETVGHLEVYKYEVGRERFLDFYMTFFDQEKALKAQTALHGRFICGRQIPAGFTSTPTDVDAYYVEPNGQGDVLNDFID